MKTETIDRLMEGSARAAMKAAVEYIHMHKLTIDDRLMVELLRKHVKTAIGQALSDAREAVSVGMIQVASHTFMASMVLAGIHAAKEAENMQREMLLQRR